jgi:hypothetical protein
MPVRRKPSELTEKTPKGLTVPVPSRERFFANLKKVAKVRKDSTPAEPKK